MKTHKPLTIAGGALALALCGIAAAPSAFAQQAPSNGAAAAFQSMDTNHDGRLARSEIPPDMVLLRSRFTTYDRNQDGYLDPQEFAAAQMAMKGTGHAMGGDAPAPHPAPESHPPGG
ncbi:MAG: hypothetical protein HOQ10_11320 [Frateuria sp.]|nr:hypothetical protein [Frateuria sp.]